LLGIEGIGGLGSVEVVVGLLEVVEGDQIFG
jgi:hypothetical protein